MAWSVELALKQYILWYWHSETMIWCIINYILSTNTYQTVYIVESSLTYQRSTILYKITTFGVAIAALA
jgi:hypothetical protein